MLLDRMGLDRKVLGWVLFEYLGVELDVFFENLWHLSVFKNCLPRAGGFTSCAVDTLVRMDVELVGPLLVGDCQFVDTVDWAYLYALNIFAVDAQLCDDPRHKRISFLCLESLPATANLHPA